MRRQRVLLITAFLALSFLAPAYAKFNPKYYGKPFITAKSAIAIDLKTKRVIYSRNSNLKLPPASTAKLVTAMVVIERMNLNDTVKISPNAARAVPSKAHLRAGAYYRVSDLLRALLISSANDAAVALAEAAAGSEREFAKLMNKKARELGAKNSRFLTASGLPMKGQYSTASDMALIAGKAINRSVIKNIMAQKYACIVGSDGRKIALRNHNKLLWKMSAPAVLGKTGYTFNARHCFAGVVHYKNKKVAIALLNSRKPWSDVRAIIFR